MAARALKVLQAGVSAAMVAACLQTVALASPATSLAERESGRLDDIESLYRQGKWREGYEMADPGAFRTDDGQVSARYLRALGLMRLGRPDLAVPQLRAILADHPRLERVRLTLATALRETGDEEGARHHFELLLGSGLDPDLDRRIRASLATLEEDKKWSVSANFALVPSTNVNLGTNHDEIDIGGITFQPSPDARQRSGIGAQYGLDAAYRLPLANSWSATARSGISRRDHRGSRSDETGVEVALGLLNNTPIGYWGVEAVGTRDWAADPSGSQTPSMDALGARIYGRFVPSKAWRVDFSAQAMKRDYRHTDILDGYRTDIQVNADRFLDSSSFVRLLAGGVYEGAGRKDLTFHDATIGVGLFREWNSGITTYLQGSVAGRWHHDDFAFAGEPRKDIRASALLRVAKRDFTVFGLAPYWQVNYTKNDSNIDLYDYNKLDISFGWTRTF